jgi:hypothetical protein
LSINLPFAEITGGQDIEEQIVYVFEGYEWFIQTLSFNHTIDGMVNTVDDQIN